MSEDASVEFPTATDDWGTPLFVQVGDYVFDAEGNCLGKGTLVAHHGKDGGALIFVAADDDDEVKP